MQNLHVVVIGAGIGGLGSALALARGGNRVTLIERDDTPMPPDPEAAFYWERTGAPQVQHPHVFLGLARTILRDRFPDVQQALADMGIEPDEIGNMGGPFDMDEATLEVLRADDDLRMVPCRRTTFEWVMRRTVLAEPGIEFRVGVGVAGLELWPAPDGPPTVTGVRLEDGTIVHADLVVATTGRRGDVPKWLADHDITIEEIVGDAGVVYFSRFYRLDHDEKFGFRGAFGAGIGAGCIGSDAGTYSITAVVDKNDKELRHHLSDSARFDKTMALLPEITDVVEACGNPMSDVHCMSGLINRTRTFTDRAGAPLVGGLVAVGDAHTCTNPAYGRGMSLALRQAGFVADVVAKHTDLYEAVREYEALSAEQVFPWYQFSVLTDQMRSMQNGSSAPSGGGDGFFSALMGAGNDPQLIRLLMRVMNLLDLPSVIMEKLPELQAKAAANPPPKPKGPKVKRPKREDLLAVTA